MHGIKTLPENVEQVGFYNRQPVYRETRREPIKEVVKVDGKIQYHTDKDGKPIHTRPHTRIKGWKEVQREYIEVPLLDSKGRYTGITQKNYHFREDPETIAAREAEAAAEQDLKEAAKLAQQHGTTLTGLFQKMLGNETPAKKKG